MKAVRIHGHGGGDLLRYEETADPEIEAPDEAIIKLKAASLNRRDVCIRRGQTSEGVSLPHILGADGAGIVVAVGVAVNNIKPGDAVCVFPARGCGRCEYCLTDRENLCPRLRVLGEHENGTYAQYVRAPAKNCFPIPAGLAFEEAAAFPIAFLTLWRMLITNAKLKPGESILILGIGGGVATAALRVAAHIGTHIIVTSSSDGKIEMAKKFGAEHGINHRDNHFAKEVRHLTGKRGVDVVVDCVGGGGWIESLASLTKGGRLVTCGATASSYTTTHLQRIFWNHLQVIGSTLGTREEFRQVLNFMEVTRTKPIIDRIFSLPEAAEAHQRMEKGQQFGKIILRMET